MKVVIVGDGKVGFTLTKELSQGGHEVVVIDNDPLVLQESQDVLDVLEARYLPGVFPPHIVQIRQQLSESEKQNRQPLKF